MKKYTHFSIVGIFGSFVEVFLLIEVFKIQENIMKYAKAILIKATKYKQKNLK